jgi:hypothetical protein
MSKENDIMYANSFHRKECVCSKCLEYKVKDKKDLWIIKIFRFIFRHKDNILE